MSALRWGESYHIANKSVLVEGIPEGEGESLCTTTRVGSNHVQYFDRHFEAA
jgi:hypothetical protein